MLSLQVLRSLEIRNLQSIGRGLRKAEGKDSMRLFDIADDLQCDNFTLRHLKERINTYNEKTFLRTKTI